MLNVACVKWGTLYGAEYVNILHAMLLRHLTVPFKLSCFTDDPAGIGYGIAIRALPGNLHGWWNKLWLFNPKAFHAGERVLFLDLDTVILRNIDALARCTQDFVILRDFYRSRGLGSGVMLWRAGAMDHVWNDFVADGYPSFSGGDQAYLEIEAHRTWGHDIGKNRILQNLFPGMFASFKADCAEGPGEAAVICFHGQPKPHNCGAAWIESHWCVADSREARTSSAA